LINDLPAEIDPCGENGEFHTFAFEGPVFKDKIAFNTGETVFRTYRKPSTDDDTDNSKVGDDRETGFWYIDLFLTF